MIELRTLGRVAVLRGGDELTGITSQKRNLALLIYLAIEGSASRDRLVSLFWGEREEEKARHSLSQALYSLRRELGEGCLHTAGDVVTVGEEGCLIDARSLEDAVAAEAWERAVDLYEGHFLEGFTLFDAPEFERWAAATRNRLMRLARRAFRRLIESRAQASDSATARSLAWRWVRLEPLEDEAQHMLITLLASSGDRTAALAQYEAYRSALEDELGVEPLDKTEELVARVRVGEVPAFQSLESAVQHHRAEQRAQQAHSRESAESAPAHGGESRRSHGFAGLLRSMKSRRYVQVTLVYLGFAWIAVEVSDVLIERGVLPDWVFTVLLFFLAVGFAIALILAWAQEPARMAARAGTESSSQVPRVRPAHILGSLGMLVVALLAVWAWLPREPSIDGTMTSNSSNYSPTRIGVLPFEDTSPDGGNAHLAGGFARALIGELDKVDSLTVVSYAAMRDYREADTPMDSIVRRHQLGSLVEGNVVVSEDRINVRVFLIDARTREVSATIRLESSRRDPIELFDELATEVARKLLGGTLGMEIQRWDWRARTSNDEAWELFQRAEQLRDEALRHPQSASLSEGMYNRADSLLARAESLDPQWLEPTVLRGWISLDIARLEAPLVSEYRVEPIREAIEHAERALEREPASASALELRGIARFYLYFGADSVEALAAAEADLRDAVGKDPNRARAMTTLADLLRTRGDLAEARVMARAALRADAFLRADRFTIFTLAQTLLDLGEIEQAFPFCEEGIRRFPDEPAFYNCSLVALATSGGPTVNEDELWELSNGFDRTLQAESPYGRMLVAGALARAGRADSARAVMNRAFDLAGEDADEPWLIYYEANVRLLLGETEEVIDRLERFLGHNPDRKSYIAREAWWTPLHGDPRFEALVDTTLTTP